MRWNLVSLAAWPDQAEPKLLEVQGDKGMERKPKMECSRTVMSGASLPAVS